MFHDLHFADVQVSHILSSKSMEWLNSTNEWLRSSWTILHSHLSRCTRPDLVESRLCTRQLEKTASNLCHKWGTRLYLPSKNE